MRGVYAPPLQFPTLEVGSSPHARGLPQSAQLPGGRTGIIPACAGFTCARPTGPRTARDHPRMRGVYDRNVSTSSPTLGSSPHARGLPSIRLSLVEGLGIIPACAGFTSFFTLNRPLNSGSSPHARGLRASLSVEARRGRIIPACAGFTSGVSAAVPGRTDHPRMRGVYPDGDDIARFEVGSSPHARGLHLAILGIPTMPYPTRRLLLSLLT